MRPRTLVDVACLTLRQESFDICLANFLDEFYSAPATASLAGTPPLLAPHFGDRGRIQDAYLAAVAKELARAQQMPVPAWVDDETRRLHRPWFASSLAALRPVLILESPPAFRERNLFVSANALVRV